jgi:hypothetical protein
VPSEERCGTQAVRHVVDGRDDECEPHMETCLLGGTILFMCDNTELL